jgi:hypothetical protein
VNVGPEHDPADDVRPTREEWEEYERAADPPRVTDPEKCVNALLLTDVCMTSPVGEQDIEAVEQAVAGWTDDQRADAFRWAALEHLHANDNPGVERVPCPPHVRALRGDEWRSRTS